MEEVIYLRDRISDENWIAFDGTAAGLRKALVDRLSNAPFRWSGRKKRASTVYLRSGSRRFWFSWNRRGQYLGVTVRRIKTKRFSVPRQPVVEAVVEELLRQKRACPRCGATFVRVRRQKFCTETCATAWRVRGFRLRRRAKTRTDAPYDYDAVRARAAAEQAEMARPETQEELHRHAAEDARAGRAQLKRIYRAEEKRLRAGRR
jgi:hypothetical protein